MKAKSSDPYATSLRRERRAGIKQRKILNDTIYIVYFVVMIHTVDAFLVFILYSKIMCTVLNILITRKTPYDSALRNCSIVI